MEVQEQLEACQAAVKGGGGFGLFGGVTRPLRLLGSKVRVFAETRLNEDLATAAVTFYRRLRAGSRSGCATWRSRRDRVTQLAVLMEAHILLPGTHPTPDAAPPMDDESTHTTLQGSNTIRVVLPFGEETLDRSAAEMLGGLPDSERVRLELVLTRLVVEPRGGLAGACRGSADLIRYLAAPMIEQATAFLTNLLPSEDVTEVELSSAKDDRAELAEAGGELRPGGGPAGRRARR